MENWVSVWKNEGKIGKLGELLKKWMKNWKIGKKLCVCLKKMKKRLENWVSAWKNEGKIGKLEKLWVDVLKSEEQIGQLEKIRVGVWKKNEGKFGKLEKNWARDG